MDARGRWYLRAKSYYSFGTTLHKVLQRFHDAGDVGVETADQAIAAYEDNWIDAGYSSPEAMQEAFGEGREILERHIEEVRSKPRDSQTFMVEKQFRMPFDQFDLIGRIDRIDEHPDGSLEIIDYKSGRTDVETEDVQTDLAMSCYQLMVGHQFPDRKVSATIVALRSGRSATYSLTNEELNEFKFDLQELGTQIFATNWEEREPFAKPICHTCDFLPLCRQYPSFDYEPAL